MSLRQRSGLANLPARAWRRRGSHRLDQPSHRRAGIQALERRDLLTISGALDGGVLSLAGDSQNDVVEIHTSLGPEGNTVECGLAGGAITYRGVTAIEFDGGAGDDRVVFTGDSTLGSLSVIVRAAELRIEGSLRATESLQFRAPSVEVEGLVSAASVDFFGEQSLDVRGDIVAPSGTIRLGSGSSGSTYLGGTLDVSAAARSDRAGGHVEIVGQKSRSTRRRFWPRKRRRRRPDRRRTARLGAHAPADRTDIIHYSVIDASGADAGNGGRVIVWSELDTRISQTTIRARGGEFGGDGGMIETSGHLGLLVTPTAKSTPAARPARPARGCSIRETSRSRT